MWKVEDRGTDVSGVWMRPFDSALILEYECECCGAKQYVVKEDCFVYISFAEKAVCHYIKQVFEDAIENLRCRGGYELDIFIPSLQLGIEIDGSVHAKQYERDLNKNRWFKNRGVDVIHIRDKKCKELKDGCQEFWFTSGSLDKAIRGCLSYLGKEVSVDVKRDRELIEKELARKIVKGLDREDYDRMFVCENCLREFGVKI